MAIIYYGCPATQFPTGTISANDIYSKAVLGGRTGWTRSASSWANQVVYDSAANQTLAPGTNLNWGFFRGRYAGINSYNCGGGCPPGCGVG